MTFWPKPVRVDKQRKPLRARLPPRPAPLSPGAPTSVGCSKLRAYGEQQPDRPAGSTLSSKRWGIAANPKRAAERRAARPEADPVYLAFVRRQPCKAREIPEHRCWGRVDPHHSGLGLATPDPAERKTADRTAIPICRRGHREVEALQGPFKGMDDGERRAIYDRWIAATRAAYEEALAGQPATESETDFPVTSSRGDADPGSVKDAGRAISGSLKAPPLPPPGDGGADGLTCTHVWIHGLCKWCRDPYRGDCRRADCPKHARTA